MNRILSPNPVALFQGMWATGIALNCNVYWGCTTGCRYCYVHLNRQDAKPCDDDADPAAGLGKFALLLNKVFGDRYNPRNATEYLLHERYPMMLSNQSDAFSALEAQHGYTRQYLQVLADLEYPVQILTKLQGWADLDQEAYIALLKRFPQLWVSVTITGDNDEYSRRWEPGAPTPKERLAAVKQLTDAGIPVEVHCTPYIVGESFRGAWDDPETYKPFLQQVADAGAFGVTVAPLCYDTPDARHITAEDKAYCQEQAWFNSPTDRPWRYFLPETSLWSEVSRIWYAETEPLELQCGLHPAFVSSVAGPPELDNACCCPPWVDRGLSWIVAAQRLRELQDEQDGAPVVVSTGMVADFLAEGTAMAEHVFDWTSWRSNIPHRYRDDAYMTRIKAMPAQVTVRDVLHFQLQEMCRWSNCLWSDVATAPLTPAQGSGEQLCDEQGDLLISYDYHHPRASWAVCRTGHGWDGRTVDEVTP
jgi:DNA repair photolyase